MKKKTVALCVLSYNGFDIVRKCLESLLSQVGDFSLKIIVCDNGSTDGTFKMLKNEFKDCILIKNKKNQSFTSSYNNMIKKVNADYYGIISNDIVFPKKNIVQKIVNHFGMHENIGMIAPKSIRPDGKVDIIRKNEFTLWEIFESFTFFGFILKIFEARKNKTIKSQNETSISEVLQDSSLFVSQDAIKSKNLFNEKLKFYFTEDQISVDCRRSNFKLLYVAEIKVQHLHQFTMNKMKIRSNWLMLKDALKYASIYHNKFVTFLILYPLAFFSFPFKLLFWKISDKI